MNNKLLSRIVAVIVVIGIAFLVSASIPFSVALPIVLAWMVWKRKTQIFDDQIEPELAKRRLKMLKVSVLVTGISFMMIVLSVLLGIFIFQLPEEVVFYIGFSWLYIWFSYQFRPGYSLQRKT